VDAGVDRGMVQLVFAIVGEKKLQPLSRQRLIRGLAAQRALNQDRRAVADVAGDDIIGEFGPADVAKRGVDGVHQVEARIDQMCRRDRR
jgi:hypothetical protein